MGRRMSLTQLDRIIDNFDEINRRRGMNQRQFDGIILNTIQSLMILQKIKDISFDDEENQGN